MYIIYRILVELRYFKYTKSFTRNKIKFRIKWVFLFPGFFRGWNGTSIRKKRTGILIMERKLEKKEMKITKGLLNENV